MRSRAEELLENPYEELVCTTFHSFCVRLLQEEALEAGFDPFFHAVDTGRPAGAADGAARQPGRAPPRHARQPGAVPGEADRADRPAQGRDGHRRRVPRMGRVAGLQRGRGRARLERARGRVRAPVRGPRPPARRVGRDGLRRDDRARDPAARRAARRPPPRVASATAPCWSTSTRTPTTPRRSCCACWSPSTATWSWSATTTSRSTASGAPRARTSSTSSRRSPTPRWSGSRSNYRSNQPILDAAHAVVEPNEHRLPKKLRAGPQPLRARGLDAGVVLALRERARPGAGCGGRDRAPDRRRHRPGGDAPSWCARCATRAS